MCFMVPISDWLYINIKYECLPNNKYDAFISTLFINFNGYFYFLDMKTIMFEKFMQTENDGLCKKKYMSCEK
jgi:hypothetical protein